MESKAKKDNPSESFVRVEDCRERHVGMTEKYSKVERALFGENGRGGMVKDLHDIKSTINTTSTFVNKVVVPIGTAIASSVVTALILAYAFHLL